MAVRSAAAPRPEEVKSRPADTFPWRRALPASHAASVFLAALTFRTGADNPNAPPENTSIRVPRGARPHSRPSARRSTPTPARSDAPISAGASEGACSAAAESRARSPDAFSTESTPSADAGIKTAAASRASKASAGAGFRRAVRRARASPPSREPAGPWRAAHTHTRARSAAKSGLSAAPTVQPECSARNDHTARAAGVKKSPYQKSAQMQPQSANAKTFARRKKMTPRRLGIGSTYCLASATV